MDIFSFVMSVILTAGIVGLVPSIIAFGLGKKLSRKKWAVICVLNWFILLFIFTALGSKGYAITVWSCIFYHIYKKRIGTERFQDSEYGIFLSSISSVSEKESRPTTTISCQNCGREIDNPQALFCRYCGAKMKK